MVNDEIEKKIIQLQKKPESVGLIHKTLDSINKIMITSFKENRNK